jgi:uncharacterized protein YkwD
MDTADDKQRTPRTSRRRSVTLLLGLTAVCALILGACTPDQQLPDAINTSRSTNHLGTLTTNLALTQKAAAWSAHMAEQCPNTCHSTLSDGAPAGWTSLAENVGRFPSSATMEQVNAAFLASAEHRANMLDAGFNKVGVAVFDDGLGNIWVTEEFART